MKLQRTLSQPPANTNEPSQRNTHIRKTVQVMICIHVKLRANPESWISQYDLRIVTDVNSDNPSNTMIHVLNKHCGYCQQKHSQTRVIQHKWNHQIQEPPQTQYGNASTNQQIITSAPTFTATKRKD
eukprot:643226_1